FRVGSGMLAGADGLSSIRRPRAGRGEIARSRRTGGNAWARRYPAAAMWAGEYELLERIGGAGGRELVRARARAREVVVERGPEEGLDRLRFEREVRAVSAIEHAAIPRVLAHGLEDGRPWVAHERAAGMTLRDLFGGRRLSPEAALV